MHHATRITFHLLRQFLPAFLLLLLTDCTVGPVISSSYDRTANFGSYQTYAWHKAELPTRLTNSGLTYSTLIDQQVKAAVESELVKLGFRPSDTTPDLIIAYDLALPANQAAETDTAFAPGFGYGYSYWYGYRYRYNTGALPGFRSITDMQPGTLVVDLINASSNQLVWRGWHEAEIDPSAVGEHDINKAVANILSRYPPVPVTTQ
ncbi:DUF4136 domain-containing protein [Pontibacter sp. KCTC 32443]|uniref:DUF4136 domain-containing protein n=1 Tax=Pontibacter TaxID=323449 RepID=UPI00164DA1E3|nr:MULTISPECIES: DUF4136 domain-containing protein [Pontibacter]MBC5775869.1 DUF4136 domain-containing protein [Pontibacter sp. KCTC 32443]